MRVLIVGQAPGPRTDPSEPLSGPSGRRLAALCGLELPDFLARFDRVNLVFAHPGKLIKGDAFVGAVAAREAAFALWPRIVGRRAVLLGHRVARAFHAGHLPYFRWHRLEDGTRIAIAPHPSGVNLWWNDPKNVKRARRFWHELAADEDPADQEPRRRDQARERPRLRDKVRGPGRV